MKEVVGKERFHLARERAKKTTAIQRPRRVGKRRGECLKDWEYSD